MPCRVGGTATKARYMQVKDHLYSSKRMFVHDGVIGADRDTQTRVRVVTDSPDIALFASNMLVSSHTHWRSAAPQMQVHV